MKDKKIYLPIFSIAVLLLVSCSESEAGFNKTKQATTEIYAIKDSTRMFIKSYSLIYNPKSNGFVKLELESGAEYEARSIDGGSFSAISLLLEQTGVFFDTIRKEIVLNKQIDHSKLIENEK